MEGGPNRPVTLFGLLADAAGPWVVLGAVAGASALAAGLGAGLREVQR